MEGPAEDVDEPRRRVQARADVAPASHAAVGAGRAGRVARTGVAKERARARDAPPRRAGRVRHRVGARGRGRRRRDGRARADDGVARRRVRVEERVPHPPQRRDVERRRGDGAVTPRRLRPVASHGNPGPVRDQRVRAVSVGRRHAGRRALVPGRVVRTRPGGVVARDDGRVPTPRRRRPRRGRGRDRDVADPSASRSSC
mmetsp:Transcript_6947/g.25554  ORF Transcript_6947/g.25554 Transcript_6947/m.25554 type:complete len:200 (-) Transcript_6947:1836-2435(-)